MLTSGKLRERIEIKSPQRTQNDSGGFSTAYTSLLTTYADVMQLSPSKDLIAQQANIIQPYQFKIRYRISPVLKIGQTIEWRKRSFEILGFEWDLMRTYITITAKTTNNTTDNGEV
jgi:SPP1 family predicted phage head-tail adaptor